MGKKPVGLVYNKGNTSSNLCLPGSLDPAIVRGKVVVCDRGTNARVEKGAVVRDAGGLGMILANTPVSGEELVADSHLLPAVAVGRKTGDLIREYARSDPNPKALLVFGGTVLNVRPSPVVAAFSSRGPNMVTPQILKPDVIGPGVNILAGWSEAIGPTGLAKDTRKTKFNIMSVLFGDKRVVRYTRELTNVGAARSSYRVAVNGPPSVGISVRPKALTFRSVGEKKRYTVTFVAKRGTSPTSRSEFGSIVWANARTQVRSPVSFSWTLL
ncbi:hypothetical protein CCACVL1_20734 [Corchorus capsularis]|uniref:Peptidase S8/S53 domain-containing protein n=1 Tax=Corchorus capsularis TaxID=210143 RepID=A0A1R3HA16_COCAP|nr:hypothetical protein CCACVL1_20734 [Corchorus capsularis]